MKVSAIPSFQNTVQTPQGSEQRTLTAITNMTPAFEPPPVMDEQGLTVSDPNKTPAAPEDTRPISPQYAQLARERRALQRERREFENQRKAAQTNSQGSDFVSLADLRSDTLSTLMKHGITPELLAQQANPEMLAVRSKLSEFEQRMAKQQEDIQVEAKRRERLHRIREAERLAAQGEDFGASRTLGLVPTAVELVDAWQKAHGEELSVAEALKMLEEEVLKDADKLFELKKMKEKYAASLPHEYARNAQSQGRGMRTLTNRDTASAPIAKRDRAIAAFWNQPIKR